MERLHKGIFAKSAHEEEVHGKKIYYRRFLFKENQVFKRINGKSSYMVELIDRQCAEHLTPGELLKGIMKIVKSLEHPLHYPEQ